MTLTAPLRKQHDPADSPITQPLHRPVELAAALHRQAGLLWCGGVTALSIILTFIGGFVSLLFSRGWAQFLKSLAGMTQDAARAQESAFRDQLLVDAERATQESYRRWLDAGLDSALTLLKEIAEGKRDPLATSTRAACGEEELFLRQLVLISPDIVHLGNASIPLLRQARERGIRFRLRLGGLDTPDEETARAVAGVIEHALAHAEHHGSVSASVFPWYSGLQLTLRFIGSPSSKTMCFNANEPKPS